MIRIIKENVRMRRTLLHILVTLLTLPKTVDGYAEYLLSDRTGCPVELSTDEVIMNSAVVAATDVETNLQIMVQAGPGITVRQTGETTVVLLDEIPKTIQVQVLGDVPTYQYAIDILADEEDEEAPAKAQFSNGGCSGLRVAGSGDDVIPVEIQATAARLVAGWATSHEAVKLTETVTFELQGDDGAGGEKEEEIAAETMTWYEHLLSQEGCTLTDLSEERLTMIHDRPVVQVNQQLKVDGVVGTLPAEVSLELATTTENVLTVVLESSDGASFEDGACQGQRVAIRPGEIWPKLTIHKDTDIYVHAVFEVPEDSSLRRIDMLEIDWLPPKEEQKPIVPIQDEEERIKDPQNRLDDAKRKTFDTFKDHVKQVHQGLKALESDDPTEVKRKRDEMMDANKKNIQMQARRQHMEAMRKDAGDVDSRTFLADKMKNQRKLPNKQPLKEEAEGPQMDLGFDLNGYYAGIGVFLLAHAVAIQVCLIASRRGAKGRRDL